MVAEIAVFTDFEYRLLNVAARSSRLRESRVLAPRAGHAVDEDWGDEKRVRCLLGV